VDDPNLLNDVQYLREVVARTQPRAVNRYWPVTLAWGCVVTAGYLACGVLGMAGKAEVLPWVWPALIFLVGFPLSWYLSRKVRQSVEAAGVRPRMRRDLLYCWSGIAAMGLLWTAGMVASGALAEHWYVLLFVWCSLYFVGYIMNGVLLSREWFWAAGVLLASLIAAFLAGPGFYWLPGIWIGGTLLLAGLLGRRNARRQTAAA
jgi:hypothetical protein